MAFSAAFSPQTSPTPIHLNQTPTPEAYRRSYRIKLSQNQGPKHGIFSNGKDIMYLVKNKKLHVKIISAASYSGSGFNDVSVSNTIRLFYKCINERDMKQFVELISSDCCLEDSAFFYAFHGRKEVLKFFSQLVLSMGENVQFTIGNVCEGEDLTASVLWHLEWRDDPIPFSRGVSFFQCSKEGERLVIKKAHIITESPIKPGKIVMVLLKILTTIFDDFPKVAEWFLKSPHAILKALLNIYKLFLGPFINPVIACYVNVAKLVAQLLCYILSILHFIIKILKSRPSKDDPNNTDHEA